MRMIAMFRIPLTVAALALVAFAPMAPARADTDPAVGQIQTFYATLLDCMKNAQSLGLKGRYDKLEPTIKQVFDLPKMTEIAVGPSWSSTSDSDKQALIAAFTRMTVANYAKNFDGYGGEKFDVKPESQEHKGDRIVFSTMVIPNHDDVAFNYRMRQNNGIWKVIDIFLDGTVSEMATRRADFSSTVASGGAPALIKKINDLADKVMAQ